MAADKSFFYPFFLRLNFFLSREVREDETVNSEIRFAEKYGSPGNGDAISVDGDAGF